MNELTIDDKLFFFEKHFFTLDGLWMIETENAIDWDTALKIDIEVWNRLIKIIIRRLKRYLKIEGNSLQELLQILSFRWSAEGWKYEISNSSFNKATTKVFECPYHSAMDRNPERHDKIPLICKNMCIPFYRSIAKECNPSIDLKRPKLLAKGDDYCSFEYSIEPLNESKKEADFKLYTPETLTNRDRIYYFEKNFKTLDGLWMICVEEEKDFDLALNLDIIVWQRLYGIVFRRVKRYLDIKGNSLKDLTSILSFTWKCEGMKHRVIKANEEEVIIEVTECPYIDAMKRNSNRRDKTSLICSEMCVPYLETSIKEFNPNITIKRQKFIGSDDDICDFVVELES